MVTIGYKTIVFLCYSGVAVSRCKVLLSGVTVDDSPVNVVVNPIKYNFTGVFLSPQFVRFLRLALFTPFHPFR